MTRALTLLLVFAAAAIATAATFVESIPTVTLSLSRNGAGVSTVFADIRTFDAEGNVVRVLRGYDVLPKLTNQQKLALRNCYDDTVNAIAAAEGIPTPVKTP